MVEPYYRDEVVTLYLGDSRTIFPSVSDQCAVMVTDPPYCIEFVSNMHGVRYETARTADRTVSIVGDEDTSLRDDIIQMWDMKPALVFGTWKVPRPSSTRHILTWIKGDHLGMGDLSLPWKPNTEEIYVLGAGFIGHRGTSALNFPGPVSWASAGRTHPHEKPIALLENLLLKCPPGVVIDPFAGTGSTLVAAKQIGRHAIGIEINADYCETTVRRLAQGAFFAMEGMDL